MRGKKNTPRPKAAIKSTSSGTSKAKAKTTTSVPPRKRQRRNAGTEQKLEDDEDYEPRGVAPSVRSVVEPDSLSARQPIDSEKEPLRAAALLEYEAARESEIHLRGAIEWRADMDSRCTNWLEDHADGIDTSRLRRQFAGWVELEADPDYFTIMLKRLGILSAKVVEVHSMDEMLSAHDCLKYGIIFLSKYHDDSLQSPYQEPPSDLWFSNQVVDNACATVAILNIVNNVNNLDIGENLSSFKRFTGSFSPEMRGEALANFDWCRRIHNAFAKMTEMLTANLALKQEAETSNKRRSKGKSKSLKGDDTPNHYIAYVPSAGALWKLDGMDRHPQCLGPLGDGEAWIDTVRGDIQKRMSVFPDDGSAGYTVLGIVEDKLSSLIAMLGQNVNKLNFIEHCISEKRDYWNRSIVDVPEEKQWTTGREPIRGPDSRYNLTQQILGEEGVKLSKEQMNDISMSSEEHLVWLRPDVVEAQIQLRESIVPLKEELELQWVKYKDRMFDYGPVIHQWLKFLEDNGAIGPLIEWHMGHANGNDMTGTDPEFDFTN